MSTIEKSVTVDVPVQTAYSQWTDFESFPQFMDGVEEVRQVGPHRLHWRARIAGISREWEALIVDQTPDERITWRAIDGVTHAGTVFFAEDGGSTRLMLRMEFRPDGIVEQTGESLNLIDRQVENDLHRFKELMESQGFERGARRDDLVLSRA